MYVYKTTDFDNASMILAFYSIKLGKIVAANRSVKRTSRENLKQYTVKARAIRVIDEMHKRSVLKNPKWWPKHPFYTVPFTIKDMTENREHYCPVSFRQTWSTVNADHAPGFPIAPIKHQAMFQFWTVVHNRSRRKGIIDNAYNTLKPGRGSTFFYDEYDRADYFAHHRTQEDKEQAEIEYAEQFEQSPAGIQGISKTKIPKYRLPVYRELNRRERVMLAEYDRPTPLDNLLLLVNVKRYYDNALPLYAYKLDPADVLPTVHNAMSFYIYNSTVHFNALMERQMEGIKINQLDAQDTPDDYRARALSFMHNPINCINPDDIYFANYAEQEKQKQNPYRQLQKQLDKAVAKRKETHEMQALLYKETKQNIKQFMPHFKPAWLKEHIYTKRQETKQEMYERLKLAATTNY